MRRALDSILSQTFGDLEVIVVDDGSTDRSAGVIETYPSDPRLHLIRQTNAGPGAARNRGIEIAKGELLAFLDADDEWLPDYLERATTRLLEPGVQDIAAFTSAYFNEPGGVSSLPMWRKRGLTSGIQRVTANTQPALFAYMLAFMSPCTTVVRAQVVRRWGGFYENHCRFGEDGFLWLKVLLNETVEFDLTPRVRFHNDASGLARNLGRARPLEPFLEYPELIEKDCPHELRPLLANLLAFRAFKTACAWGYWGDWKKARALRNKYRVPGDWKLPWWFTSGICATPMAPLLASALRLLPGSPTSAKSPPTLPATQTSHGPKNPSHPD